jgi:hypothetical protein
MKRLLFIPFTALLLVSACTSEEKIQLLNGENLDNWTVFLPDSIDQESVFRMENGNLFVSGIPNGYIRTKASYSAYKLHVEWRWLAEPKNSGVLLHTTGEDLIWPNCIEAQLMAGKAGDFVLIGKGAGITVDNTPYLVESEENRYTVINKMNESSESAPGEWNSYDITVTASEIELVVNDVVQNTGFNPTKTEGNICIQSEGGPMEFRNIYLVPLK